MEEPRGIQPSKNGRSLQHVEKTLALLAQYKVVVEVIAQLLVHSHPLNVKSLDVHWFNLRCFPAEVFNHLFCLAGLNVKMVELTPVNKVRDDPPSVPIRPPLNDFQRWLYYPRTSGCDSCLCCV